MAFNLGPAWWSWSCWCWLVMAASSSPATGHRFGLGRADVTGPPVEIAFMGYASMSQRGTGIHLRQFSRAVVFEDQAGGKRLAFASVECGMMGHGLRMEVVRRLRQRYGDLYTDDNVMLTGTHTHSGPGGFLMNLLFDVTTMGFVRETFDALAAGIMRSIVRAHNDLADGRVSISYGELLDANINRSPTAYQRNPDVERARYVHNVDKTMTQLRFERPGGEAVGAFTWFAVHPVSMNKSNTLVSSDNLGVAALMLERAASPGSLPGKGRFVGAFVSSNLGDVSPNLRGPRCQSTGLPCDGSASSCDDCAAAGPGRDMADSARIIGQRLFAKAWELLKVGDGGRRYLTGGLSVAHQYHDMSAYNATYWDPQAKRDVKVRGCPPAMGYGFAVGTTDGRGVGLNPANPLWNFLRNLIYGPSEQQRQCHHPKPILITTGELSFPFEWQPSVVPAQLAVVGGVALACVPAEFTTMSGRRLRDTLRQALRLRSNKDVLVTGLCNSYADYVTTPEEYQAQRYEGASTIYGPHTLTLFLDIYRKMAEAIYSGRRVLMNDRPLDFFNDLISLTMGVMFDTAGWSKEFGDTLVEPPATARPDDTVKARFVGANPRTDLRHENSYLAVERLEGDRWTVVDNDASWDTQFEWFRSSTLLGTSEAEVRWTVPPDVRPGQYRLRYFTTAKLIHGATKAVYGTSRTFQVFNTR